MVCAQARGADVLLLKSDVIGDNKPLYNHLSVSFCLLLFNPQHYKLKHVLESHKQTNKSKTSS